MSINRRHAIRGAVVGGAATPFLAACGSDEESSSSASGGESPAPAGTELGPTSDVPEGGGAIFGEQKVVVTQPTAGEFKGFDSTCTHQGCQVSEVSDGFIVCSCHNSRFAIDTGEPTDDSPATAPLGSVQVSVADDQITLR